MLGTGELRDTSTQKSILNMGGVGSVLQLGGMVRAQEREVSRGKEKRGIQHGEEKAHEVADRKGDQRARERGVGAQVARGRAMEREETPIGKK